MSSPHFLNQRLQTRLQQRRQQARYRSRHSHSPSDTGMAEPSAVIATVDGRNYLNFCSNDYLGLSVHPQIIETFSDAAQKYGVGARASHLVSGHSAIHHQLELELAQWTGRERALVFSSGYMANLGVISALVQKGDLILEDRLNHASLLDGAMLSPGRLKRYRHADASHAQSLLEREIETSTVNIQSGRWLVTDGVFSMDGDLAPLTQLADVAKANNAALVVDDAHGFGCLGPHGGGCSELLQLDQQHLPILIGTFGKALGGFGAFVCGDHSLIEGLIQFARSYIYTTALPPAVAAGNLAAVQLVRSQAQFRQQLQANIDYFHRCLAQQNIAIPASSTAIQPILVGSDSAALAASASLWQQGIWVSAIRPPTVPEGSARLRITITAAHRPEHIERLVDALQPALLAAAQS